MKVVSACLTFLCVLVAQGVALMDDFTVSDKGLIRFEGGEIGFGGYTPGFAQSFGNAKIRDGKLQDDLTNWVLRAKAPLGSQLVDVEERIVVGQADTAFDLSYRMVFPSIENVLTSFVDVCVAFDDIRFVIADGKELRLPLEAGETLAQDVRTLVFMLPNGKTLTVQPRGVHYVDNRRFGKRSCSFRCTLGRVDHVYSGTFRFTLGNVGQRQLDLKPYATRDFKDEVAEDDKGGWTDQGPGNDLRMITPGLLTFGGITYSVIDAAKNNGKSVLALAGELRSATLPRSVEIDLGEGVTARGMSLLHASAWTLKNGEKCAEIEVEYADGSKSVHGLISGRDIVNWVGCKRVQNARAAFKSWNIVCDVGLSASHFEFARPHPRKLRLRIAEPQPNQKFGTTRHLLWLIAGITLTDHSVSFKSYEEKPLTIEGADWIPLTFKSTTVPGSALDFSFIPDAPAGKYGPATCDAEGHFSFANGKRIRLYGANLCQQATVIDKAESDALAARLARTGYTTVRFHHFENRLVDAKSKASFDVSPEKLDLFFYQFAAMKKAGLYVNIDLYASRTRKKGEIPGEDDTRVLGLANMKAMLPLSREHLENYKKFCRTVFTRVNPYTGVTLAEDPALIAANMVNEDNLGYYWSSAQAAWQKAYAEHCAKHPELNPTASVNNRDFLNFMYVEKQLPMYQEIIAFCRNELKMKAGLTSLAMEHGQHLALATRHFDWIDKHCYYSHPVSADGSGQLIPNANAQPGSPIESFGQPSPFEIMCTRYAGKPFGSTEWNFCFPNPFRHEGPSLFAYYAALQDWNLLCRFQWSCGPWNLNDKVMVCSPFDAASDPVMQLTDRIGAALFTRGDAAVSPRKYVKIIPKNLMKTSVPLSVDSAFHTVGRVAQIGIAVEGDTIPKGWTIYTGPESLHTEDRRLVEDAMKLRKATSATGQFTLDAKNHTLRIVTPRTEVLTATSGAMEGDFLRVKELSGVQTIAAISRTDKRLSASDDIVLLHLADVQNSGARFNNEQMIVQETWGKLPLRVKKRTAQVALRVDSPRRVFALGPDGDIRGAVAAKWANSVLTFTVDTGAFDGGVMAYHVVR